MCVMKKYNHLTIGQRYTISVCLKEKMPITQIARLIGVDKSTVIREIRCNSNSSGHYTNRDAEMFARMSAERSHQPRKMTEKLKKEITGMLRRKWSPETIVGYLKNRKRECVSAE